MNSSGDWEEASRRNKKNLPSIILQPRGSNHSQCLGAFSHKCYDTHPPSPPFTVTPPLDIEESTKYLYKDMWLRKSNWSQSRKPNFHSLYFLWHLGDTGYFTYYLCSLSLCGAPAKRVYQELHSALLTTMLTCIHELLKRKVAHRKDQCTKEWGTEQL